MVEHMTLNHVEQVRSLLWKNMVCFFCVIIRLLWIFSGFIVCLLFIYFCVKYGKNQGNGLSRTKLASGDPPG